MLKFFRTIRKKLIDQDKVRKYLLYALGEILLVVIGILIALQINNWNEYRKERLQEKQLLAQLRSEFESNLEQLDNKIRLRDTMIHASNRLLAFIDYPSIRTSDSVYSYIGQTILNPTFDPIVHDIISPGSIELIQNAELKQKLTRWTSDVIQVTEEEGVWTKFRSETYVPELINHSSLRTISNRYWQNEVISMFQLDGVADLTIEIGDSNRDLDVNTLLDDTHFEDHVAQCLSMAELTNSQSMSLRNRIVDILKLIENELN